MSLAINSLGTLFKLSSAGSAGTFTTIPEVKEVNAPNVKIDLNDVSSHDSAGGFREFLPGMKDGGTISAPIWWVPSNTVHVALRTNAYAANLRGFKVIYPDTSDNTVDCLGYVIDAEGQGKFDQPLMSTLQVKVTGLPVWS